MATKTPLIAFLFALLTIFSISCDTEDPGPLQEDRKDFPIIDFDRLEMGSGLNIKVEQSNTYGIQVRGDRRNVDDLEVYKSGSTLIVKFEDNNNRKHQTYITITMPRLEAVNFSGACVSKVTGFQSDDDIEFILSGASVAQLDADYDEVNVSLSGASSLAMSGAGDQIHADVSGASVLTAFDYLVREADITVAGASSGKINVDEQLRAKASGASSLLYRGNPSVTSEVSGASVVQKD